MKTALVLGVSAAFTLAGCGSGTESPAPVTPPASAPATATRAAQMPAPPSNEAVAAVPAMVPAIVPAPAYSGSYTLPSGEVLTAANVQDPPPTGTARLSAMAGVHITDYAENPDHTKVVTFTWTDQATTPMKRRVILTPDTVVDFNGKLGTIDQVTAATAKGSAVVATMAKDGVYAVMLRFGHGLLQASGDELTPRQVAALESVAPTPTAASNLSFEKKAKTIAAGLSVGDPAKEQAVTQAIIVQTEGVRDAHNAGFGPSKSLIVNFNAALAAVLTPDQIDTVKDAMTSNKTPTTFKVYHQIVTDLNADDDKVIMSLLKQAREDSLSVKNLEEMAPIYKTYKDQVEAYINAHGHDYKALYKTFVDGQKAAGTPAPQN